MERRKFTREFKFEAVKLIALERHVLRWKVTRIEAAKRLGITQPRLNDLLKGRFDKFSLGALFDLATRAGIKIKVTIDSGTPRKASGKAAARKAA